MSFVPKLSFANFVCRFGNKKVLKDYYKQIVNPAFFDDTLYRNFGANTAYFIYEPQIVHLKDGDNKKQTAIVGKFIKDTILQRTQFFKKEEGLIPDARQLASSPSAFFVLILENHKLLYLTETPDAPPLKAFKASIHLFLKMKHDQFLQEELKRLNLRKGIEKVTKPDLLEEHPQPTLELIPLNSLQSIEAYILSLAEVKRIELDLIIPNDEIDGDAIYRGLRERQQKMNATKTKVIHQNKEGLDKTEAAKEIHSATATGNQNIKLVGRDQSGNLVRGNNESIKFSIPVPAPPQAPEEKAEKLNEIFNQQFRSGAIKVDLNE